jgi:hypothetical protein
MIGANGEPLMIRRAIVIKELCSLAAPSLRIFTIKTEEERLEELSSSRRAFHSRPRPTVLPAETIR